MRTSILALGHWLAMRSRVCVSQAVGSTLFILHLWTPRWMQEVKCNWARSRMLSSVRPVIAALWPLACMGVRGSKPDQVLRALGTLQDSGLFDPVSPTVVPCFPSTSYVPDSLWRSFGVMPQLPPESYSPLSSSKPPIRSELSCWLARR